MWTLGNRFDRKAPRINLGSHGRTFSSMQRKIASCRVWHVGGGRGAMWRYFVQTAVRPISREKKNRREGYKHRIYRGKAANVRRRMCLTLDIDCPSWRFLFRAASLLATATTTDDPMTTACNPRDFNIILPGWQHVRAVTFDIAKPRVIVRLPYRLVAEYRFRWIYADGFVR